MECSSRSRFVQRFRAAETAGAGPRAAAAPRLFAKCLRSAFLLRVPISVQRPNLAPARLQPRRQPATDICLSTLEHERRTATLVFLRAHNETKNRRPDHLRIGGGWMAHQIKHARAGATSGIRTFMTMTNRQPSGNRIPLEIAINSRRLVATQPRIRSLRISKPPCRVLSDTA